MQGCLKGLLLVSLSALLCLRLFPVLDIGLLALALFGLAYFLNGSRWLAPLLVLGFLFLLQDSWLLVRDPQLISWESILLELLILLTSAYLLAKYPTPYDYFGFIHPDFRLLSLFKYRFRARWVKRLTNQVVGLGYAVTKLAPEIDVHKQEIAGFQGRALKLEIYSQPGSHPRPVIVALHGGGFWMRAIPTYKQHYQQFVLETGATVVFVDYSSSLDAPYPAGVEDCYAATLWVYQQAESLGLDPHRIALYGDSAGGALVAAVSLMLRDRQAFQPCLQMLIYPLLAASLQTESVRQFQGVPMWNPDMSRDARDLYLRNQSGPTPAYAYPLQGSDFSGLPPAYIEAVEFDSLRDDAYHYAEALKTAQVPVTFQLITGAVHAFESVARSPITQAAMQARVGAFQQAFRSGTS